MPPINTPDGLFHDGDPLTGVQGTIVTAEFMNNTQGAVISVQDELKSILTAVNIQVNDTKTDQVLQAIDLIIQSSAYALPIGVPIPYPAAIPPTGYLKCNGAVFDKTTYPKLAKAYPSGVLPDLRAEFIRGWDDGRGVDVGREILTAQGESLRAHMHEWGLWTYRTNDASLADFAGTTILKQIAITQIDNYDNFPLPNPGITTGGVVNATTKLSGGPETRSRNISFLYILRAA